MRRRDLLETQLLTLQNKQLQTEFLYLLKTNLKTD